MKTEYNFLNLLNIYRKSKIVIPTIKLHLFISVLFIMFTGNCIAMNTPYESSTSSSYSKISESISWSDDNDELKEVQNLIHNKDEDDQFEVKGQIISIEKLAQIVLSFINGTKSPSYIIIGVAEDAYFYKKMPESEFNTLSYKPDGIYSVTNENNKINYYQINNSERKLLSLKSSPKSGSIVMLDQKLSQMEDNNILPFDNFINIFQNLATSTKPIDSNNTMSINFPKKINIDEANTKALTIFKDKDSYIKKLKEFIENKTYPKIKFDNYVTENLKEVNARNNQKHKIIILKIIPGRSHLIELDKSIYARFPTTGQPDYSSKKIGRDEQWKIEKIRLQNRQSKFSTQLGGPSLDFMDFVDYMDREKNLELENFEDILIREDGFKGLLDIENNNILMLAIYHKQEKIVKFLLEKYDVKQAIIQYNLKDCKNAFEIACNEENWKAAKYILEKLPDDLLNKSILKRVKETLEEGLKIINSSNDNSSECKNIKKSINAKLLKY